ESKARDLQAAQLLRLPRLAPQVGTHKEDGVVLQVPSDTGQVGADFDAQPAQMLRWPDPRPHQQDRGMDASGAKNHLLGAKLGLQTLDARLDADDALAVENEIAGNRRRRNRQIPAPSNGGIQI